MSKCYEYYAYSIGRYNDAKNRRQNVVILKEYIFNVIELPCTALLTLTILKLQ